MEEDSKVSTTPQVSVIVPMYNLSQYILETLDSLKAQELKDVEYLLIDDGSTDDTVSLVEAAITDDPRFHLVTQENKGPSAARNHGLRLAHGEYICFVDGDDRLDSSALKLMYEAAKQYDADMVTGDTHRFDKDHSWPMPSYARHGVSIPGVKTLKTHPELLHALGPCAKLFRRELVANQSFPERIRLGEDQPFVLFALANSKTIVTIDAVVYHYRVREGETQSLTQNAMTNSLQALKDLFEMESLGSAILDDPELKDAYLTRVIYADVWPRAKSALQAGDTQIQLETLDAYGTWLAHFDDDRFNRLPALYFYPVACLHLKLPREVHSARYQLIQTLLGRLRPITILKCMGTVIVEVFKRLFHKMMLK